MNSANVAKIEQSLADDALVLDVGGWGKPFKRADWVLDLMPYESRGRYGDYEREGERFTWERWVERDICAREPWPFADKQFEYVTCSHTLEDVRDPIWVCSELVRVARRGYLEVPSRLEEQAWGVGGPWVGWSHHRWLIDIDDTNALRFVIKPHSMHGRDAWYLPAPLGSTLTPEERVLSMFWEREFKFREQIFSGRDAFDQYLGEFVAFNRPRLEARISQRKVSDRIQNLRRRAQALLHRNAA